MFHATTNPYTLFRAGPWFESSRNNHAHFFHGEALGLSSADALTVKPFREELRAQIFDFAGRHPRVRYDDND